jgi:membrane protease YdiL (CAAX protease family)
VVAAKLGLIYAVEAVVLTFLLSFLVNLFKYLNIEIYSAVPWFVFPVLAVAVLALVVWRRHERSLGFSWHASYSVLVLLGVLILVLAGTSLLDSLVTSALYESSIRLSTLGLPGDVQTIPGTLRSPISLVMPVAYAVIEEVSFRGVFQLRASAAMSPRSAAGIGAVLFVLAHIFNADFLTNLFFLICMAITCSILAMRLRSLTPSLIVHAGVNLTVVLLVFAARH